MSNTKLNRGYKLLTIVIVGVFIFLLAGAPAQAAGFTDEADNEVGSYSDYPLDNYQLDFYVDMSWGGLPWHWKDSIGKGVDLALYKLTDMLWGLSRNFSNGTGYVVQEAFNFNFISRAVDTIGKNIQAFAGINGSGFTGGGFYNGFILILVFVLGVYVTYVGLLKRETTKAINAVVSFVVIFVLTSGIIAFAPAYIRKINDFSSDVSTSALSVGLKVMGSESTEDSGDSVDLVRKSLFAIQIEKPWLLLQYGTTDISELTDGEERIDNLLSKASGDNREDVVINEVKEIEENKKPEEEATYANSWMSVSKVAARLGMVLLVLIINIVISIFVLLFCALMLFSQIQFMIYATMLPISFLLSMIPTCNGMVKSSIEKLFNIIMLRAGYTLIITVAFSVSSLLYSLSGEMPFLFIAFLQILCFAGVYMKHDELLGLFTLKSNENHGIMSRMQHSARRLGHTAAHTVHGVKNIGKSRAAAKTAKETKNSAVKNTAAKGNAANAADVAKANNTKNQAKKPVGERVGRTAGKVADTPGAVKDGVAMKANQVKNMPTHLKHSAQTAKDNIKASVGSVKTGAKQEQTERRMDRDVKKMDYTNKVAKAKEDLSGGRKNSATHSPVNTPAATKQGNTPERKPSSATHAKLDTGGSDDTYKVNGKTYTKKQFQNLGGTDEKKPKTRRKTKGEDERR